MKLVCGLALVAALATLAVAAEASAQDRREKFPGRPVALVTAAPGIQADILARMMGEKMSGSWGQPVVVVNRAGGGGTVAASHVAKAAPDGHTLLLLGTIFTIGAVIRPNLPYDALRDFSGVTQIGYGNLVLVVTPSLRVKSLRELIVAAKAKPGEILFASGGAGSVGHIDGERIKLAAGINVKHVAFKGAPEALLQVLGGRVHYGLTSVATAIPFITEGQLVPLAVSNPQGSPLLPDVPTIGEVLPGYKRVGSTGLLAPAGTPRPILDQINQQVRRVFDLPDIKAKLRAMDFTAVLTTPGTQTLG